MLSHSQDNNTQNSIKTNQAEEEEEEEASWEKMHSFLSSPTPKSEISKSVNKSPPQAACEEPHNAAPRSPAAAISSWENLPTNRKIKRLELARGFS
jgi:hypothetical protein